MNHELKPTIVFDTDMDTDCDDAGALAILLQAARKGDVNLAGIIVDVPDRYAATACEVLCNWYGVQTPIGTFYDVDFSEKETDRYVRYRTHRTTLPENIYYNRTSSKLIGKTDRDYPAAVETYRRILSQASDNSVTVLAVGFLTAIEQLWQSPADTYSSLNGFELFRQKVCCVVSMGDATYPFSTNYNFNYNMDREGAKAFFDRCPCPIYVSPDGMDVITGHTFSSVLPVGHPLRMFYEIYNEGPNKGRMSWDLIALLYAMNPENPIFTSETHGSVRYHDEINQIYWDEAGSRTDYQVTSTISAEEMSNLLEQMLTESID